MEKYLSADEVKELVIRAKSGDNEAWERLYHNFESYGYKCAGGNRLKKFNLSD